MTAAFDREIDEFESDPLADTVSMEPSPPDGEESSTGVPQLDDPAIGGEGTQSTPDVSDSDSVDSPASAASPAPAEDMVPGGGFGWPG